MSARIIAGPLRVEPYALEKELKNLWRQAGGAGAAANAVMQVVTANLIAVGASPDEADAMQEIALRMIGRAPCRVILVIAEPADNSPALTAEAAIICQDSEKCRACVCCEFIRLTARGSMAGDLPRLTAALSAADLPAILWWPKPPFECGDFKRFVEQANRLIVDSTDYSAFELAQLSDLVEQRRKTGAAISDLNWARLTPYRRLFARFFDSPDCREHLAAIEEIRIEAREAAGHLLAGWLQAQMAGNGFVLSGELIHLIKTGVDSPVFTSLSMKCAQGANEFVVVKTGACVLEACAKSESKTLNCSVKDDCLAVDVLLGAEIAFRGHDVVFENALKKGVGIDYA